MKTPVPLKARLSYWFDNLMGRGLWTKIGVLAIVTVIFILIMGIIATFAYGDVSQMAPWVWWKTVMTSLGKSTPGSNDGPPIFIALMIVSMIYGMFLSSILIGFISGSIRTKVDELMKGTGMVIEEDHTIILGFNDSTFVLIGELIEANRNQRAPQTVVVLGEEEKSTMDDEILARFGKPKTHPKTRIISRSGSIYDLANLERCAIANCKAVIINGSDDFETIKAIMACTHLLNSGSYDSKSFSVAIILEQRNADAARIAGRDNLDGDRLELLPLQEILAKIIVHTSRQPGLSQAYIELFNFTGNEFYVVASDKAFDDFYGHSIAQINLMLKDSIAIGTLDPDKGIMLLKPAENIFERGQSLILVEQDDDSLHVSNEPAIPDEHILLTREPVAPINSLIIGTYPILRDVLLEYGRYLPEGSTITVLMEHDDDFELNERVVNALDARGISVSLSEQRRLNRTTIFSVLDEVNPDCVVVLSDHCAENPMEEDKQTITLLLYLRDYRAQKDARFSITSEMLLGTNREIASITDSDDIIIGRQIAALLMAQISENRSMRAFFSALLSNEGFEVYLKHATNYVPEGIGINLFTAIDSAACQGEMLIGIQQYDSSGGTLTINPPKFDVTGALKTYTFGKNDYFVVLSETL